MRNKMKITGKNIIAGIFSGDFSHGFNSFDVKNNRETEQKFVQASAHELDTAVINAQLAFTEYSKMHACKRAEFLREISQQIMALGDFLVETACLETGLPEARIIGERGRTVNQLLLFADWLENEEYHPIIDKADPARQPLPKPDTRLAYIPLGVVAVFGASNFPLAFSTAGGDTASALAAGCPVVMKAHQAHPGTSELIASAITTAAKKCEIHAGVFSLIQGTEYALSEQLVKHPLVKAVGFTGSERVGMILQQHINQRAEPIPFYGELGSVNPQFVLAQKFNHESASLAEQFIASLMMGHGQFCTSPGIWLIPNNTQFTTFINSAKNNMAQQAAGVMLTPIIAKSYNQTVEQWQQISGVELIAQGQAGKEYETQAALFQCNLTTFAQSPCLQQEVFGPCALIVTYDDFAQLLQFVSLMKGNLTASIHANHDDLAQAETLLAELIHKVGRIIYNQMPTGVEVCASMNHGGPFPASTDVRVTSVGTQAIKRFQRPICYQNMPESLLPVLLRD
jgi:NADP-dependent aldehyde dehydrogenase